MVGQPGEHTKLGDAAAAPGPAFALAYWAALAATKTWAWCSMLTVLRLRAFIAVLALSGALAAPVVAAACMTSDRCPLEASRAETCHGSGNSSDAARPSAPSSLPGSDARSCCEELQRPATQVKPPALQLLTRPVVPAEVTFDAPHTRPACLGALPSEAVGRARGAPSLALLCTLLI